MKGAVWICNAAGSLSYVNDAFTRLTGYTRREALGQRWTLLQVRMLRVLHVISIVCPQRTVPCASTRPHSHMPAHALQGPDTDPVVLADISGAIEEGSQATVEILNYRKDGTSFWTQVRKAHDLGTAPFSGIPTCMHGPARHTIKTKSPTAQPPSLPPHPAGLHHPLPGPPRRCSHPLCGHSAGHHRAEGGGGSGRHPQNSHAQPRRGHHHHRRLPP
jgi:hypothetical protein